MTEQAKSGADMTDDEITEKVIAIVAQTSLNEASAVTLDSTPDELGITSLELVEIVFAIEETFDVTVPYNANDDSPSDFDISTVGTVVAAVKRLIAEKPAS